jgi:hypothetical protein
MSSAAFALTQRRRISGGATSQPMRSAGAMVLDMLARYTAQWRASPSASAAIGGTASPAKRSSL